jgi:hypothetical protein
MLKGGLKWREESLYVGVSFNAAKVYTSQEVTIRNINLNSFGVGL